MYEAATGLNRCRWNGGCLQPVEWGQMNSLDREALMLFSEVQTQWVVVAGFGGAFKSGLDYSAVRLVAESHGFEWSTCGDLLERIRICERFLLRQESEERERERLQQADNTL